MCLVRVLGRGREVESDADKFMSPMRGPNFVVFTFLLYKMPGGRKMN